MSDNRGICEHMTAYKMGTQVSFYDRKVLKIYLQIYSTVLSYFSVLRQRFINLECSRGSWLCVWTCLHTHLILSQSQRQINGYTCNTPGKCYNCSPRFKINSFMVCDSITNIINLISLQFHKKINIYATSLIEVPNNIYYMCYLYDF